MNLVEFLLKNGPPSAISSFKYDIYQFRSFSDYSAYDDGIDRGEASIYIYINSSIKIKTNRLIAFKWRTPLIIKIESKKD